MPRFTKVCGVKLNRIISGIAISLVIFMLAPRLLNGLTGQKAAITLASAGVGCAIATKLKEGK